MKQTIINNYLGVDCRTIHYILLVYKTVATNKIFYRS